MGMRGACKGMRGACKASRNDAMRGARLSVTVRGVVYSPFRLRIRSRARPEGRSPVLVKNDLYWKKFWLKNEAFNDD